MFHAGELDAHHHFGVADEAERMSDVVTTRLSIGVRQFIETQPFMFVGTAYGGQAGVTCDIVQSRRDANGGLLPVVRVIDTKTLRFVLPVYGERDGGRIDAGRCNGSGVGLLFVDFMRGIRYRINGRATLRTDLSDADAAPWPVGSAIVELAVAQAYGNCGTRVVRLRPRTVADSGLRASPAGGAHRLRRRGAYRTDGVRATRRSGMPAWRVRAAQRRITDFARVAPSSARDLHHRCGSGR